MNNEAPIWKSEKRKINELKPYEFNPRTITDIEIERLKAGIEKVGYNAPILIDTDNTIIAGHQRWHVLKLLKNKEVTVMVPSRKLTEHEFKQVNIQDNVDFGDWDKQVLSDIFNMVDLNEWGKDFNNLAGSWDSDIDLAEKDGSHIEGIKGKISVSCDQDIVDSLKEDIENIIKEKEYDAKVK